MNEDRANAHDRCWRSGTQINATGMTRAVDSRSGPLTSIETRGE